jgi:hypothetical protein
MPAVRQEKLGDSTHEEVLAMEKRPESDKHLITSDMLRGLPDPVRRYMAYGGLVILGSMLYD